MTPNPTDLRRAKALRPLLRDQATCLANPCKMEPCACSDELVAVIRASDEAAGMVLVPKEASKQQILAGLQAAFDYYGRFRLKALWPWSRGNHPSDILRVCYCAMLAAHGGEDG